MSEPYREALLTTFVFYPEPSKCGPVKRWHVPYLHAMSESPSSLIYYWWALGSSALIHDRKVIMCLTKTTKHSSRNFKMVKSIPRGASGGVGIFPNAKTDPGHGANMLDIEARGPNINWLGLRVGEKFGTV